MRKTSNLKILLLVSLFGVKIDVAFPQVFYPQIPRLESRDFLFQQYADEISMNEKQRARNLPPSLNFYIYVPNESDSFFSVAARTSLWQETISTANGISESHEKIRGRKLYLPTANGIFIPESPNSTIEYILAGEFAKEISEGNLSPYIIGDRKFWFIPGRRFSPSSRAYFLNPGMSLPLEKKVLTSSFGYRKNPVTGNWKFHKGIDLAAPEGTPILACKTGTVKYTKTSDPIYGNCIAISHSGNYESFYAHLSQILVQEGQSVTTGAKIGKVGVTGQTTGPHLHFELKQNGQAVNPEEIVKERN